jgi:hypothetical protein
MFSEKQLATLAECRRKAAEATPEHNLRAAALAREVKPLMKDDRGREILEEMALMFEARNASRKPQPAQS